ncbi:hypothetical protein QBC40DRAFT_282486 [Triangularia verruculosa]|uniref:Protoporphyrinogen oxidase n=1 Tax=Triangularia verruculosa TaxID=2587418 RepID=A0AAN6XID7_9PEZI|nr:hypothetical protein QBC40DRAFT_282486 [Triangularia verruculosa]
MLATSQRCLAQRQRWITTHFSSLSSSSPRWTPVNHGRLFATSSRRQLYIEEPLTILDRPPASVAILGGGLTGLTTAFFLSRANPHTKITIYEANDHTGGWIDSQEVKVRGLDGQKGTVCFQRGARLVKPQHQTKSPYRYDDLIFYFLVDQLNLADSLQSPPKGVDLAKFIYYPDHLVRLPGMSDLKDPLKLYRTLTSEPLFEGLFPSLAHLVWTQFFSFLIPPSLRPPTSDDLSRQERSVGQHFQRLFGQRDLVDNLLSAVMHGIYGGDVWKLSVQRSPFWNAPKDGRYPPLGIGNAWVDPADVEVLLSMRHQESMENLARAGLDRSAHWFPSGLDELTDALGAYLQKRRNVTIKKGAAVTSLKYAARTDRVALTTSKQPTPVTYEKVISTLYAKTLANICPPGQLPSLEKTTAATIRVVNLWYPQPGLNHPNNGFGYLIPQSVSFEENPDFVLGVLFDSDREWVLNPKTGQYDNRGKDTIRGTKLTVMMGGHYWDHLPKRLIPDGPTAIEMAKKAVARHMGWPESYNEHVVASTKLCQDCIPQHLVGHRERMKAAHGELLQAFHGRVAVAGGSYQSPGVLPSIRAGHDVAVQVSGWLKLTSKEENRECYFTVGDTGLWRFAHSFVRLLRMPENKMPLRGAKAKEKTLFSFGAFIDSYREKRQESQPE